MAPERHGDEHKGGEATSRMHHNNDARSILSPECEPTAMAAGCVRRRVAQLSLVVDARAIGSKSNRMGGGYALTAVPQLQRCGANDD